MDSVKLHFGMETSSWIIGKAIAEMCDLNYDDDTIGFLRMTFDKDKLNDAISKVMLVTGSKETQQGNVKVIELLDSPAGDEYKLSDEGWREFKKWLASHGEVESETDNTIVMVAKGYKEWKAKQATNN